MTALHVQGLLKRFGRFTAVGGIDLEVPAGQICAFIGPNGAGKTTTMQMVAGLLRPTAGRIAVCGHDVLADPVAAKRCLGYIPDRPYLYGKLTGGETLRFVGGLWGVPAPEIARRAAELLALFEIAAWVDQPVETYSHGMKQRLVLAAALLHRPDLLVVDEPMVGLDPRGARLLKEVLRRQVRERGAAVLLSTHTLAVAEELCDRLAIIDRGRIVAAGTLAEVRAQAGGGDQHLEGLFLELTGGDDSEGAVRALGEV